MSLFTSIASPKTIKKLHTVNYKDLEKAGIKLRCARLGFIIDLRYKEKIKLLNEVLSLFKNYIEICMTSDVDVPEECPIAHFVEIDFFYEESDDELYQIFLSNIEPLKNYIFTQENGHDKLADVYITAYKKIKSYDILIKGCKDTLNTAEEGPQKMLVQKILALDLASREENKKKKTQAYNSKLKFRENKTRLDLELNPEDAALFNQIKKEENLKSNIDVMRFLMKNHLPAKETLSEDDENAFNIFYENYKAASDRLNILALLCNTGKSQNIKPDNITDVAEQLSEAREYIFKISDKRNTFKNADIKEIRKIRNINSTLPKNASQIQAKGIDTEKVIDIFSVIKDETYIYVENR